MSHLEKELELNGLEAPDEMPINAVTQQAPQKNSEKPKPACHHHNQCRQLKWEEDQARNNTISANNNNGSAQTNPNPNNKVLNKTKTNNINIQRDRRPRPVRHVVELTTPQRNATLEQMQQTDRPHGIDHRKYRIKVNRMMPKATRAGMSELQPKP